MSNDLSLNVKAWCTAPSCGIGARIAPPRETKSQEPDLKPGEHRTVDLPVLQEVKEGQLGSMLVGVDHAHHERPSSGAWWEAVVRKAAETYSKRLQAKTHALTGEARPNGLRFAAVSGPHFGGRLRNVLVAKPKRTFASPKSQ